jgi:acetyltransferase-like isoleucine patch superfamily enzyme
MINVIIVGSGAVAAELTSYIDDQNKYVAEEKQLHLKGYLEFEENIEKYWGKYKLKKPVLSNIHTYSIEDTDHFIIGIADVNFRKKMIEALEDKGGKITGFIHHTSIVSETAHVGAGTIIYPHCIIGPNAFIGKDNFITSYSFISHDCAIGNNNFFSTSGLGGRVTIGDDNFFGIRSTVIPGVKIGSRNIIQAGMIVDKDVENEGTVFYRFKEKVIAIPK